MSQFHMYQSPDNKIGLTLICTISSDGDVHVGIFGREVIRGQFEVAFGSSWQLRKSKEWQELMFVVKRHHC